MLYPVKKLFKDKQDNGRRYQLNDWYPRFGLKANNKRVEELIRLGYIHKEDEEDKQDFPKHVGGGWYELSNGEKVQGKEEAEKLEGD